MIEALYIAATGMHVEQTNIDTISNNLANLNTAAFKKSRVSFDDLMYRDMSNSIASIDQSSRMKIGMGAAISQISKDFTPGPVRGTENPLDIAIKGQGFIEVEMENGEVAYTRNGALQVLNSGYLATSDGFQLVGNIQIPPDASEILISRDGLVQVRVNNDDKLYEVGSMELANFMNSSGLNPIGNNLFLATEDSGVAYYSEPGQNGTGVVEQGFLEGSNVDLIQEMIDLVIAQRAYEVNSKVIKAADEMLRINNNLRG